jgi:hypothetical protein
LPGAVYEIGSGITSSGYSVTSGLTVAVASGAVVSGTPVSSGG